MTSPNAAAESRPRRRVRIAHAVLNRVRRQRDWFANAYAAASSAQARFNAAAAALRAAGSERVTRGDPAVARRLEALSSEAAELVEQLHQQQEQHANRVLRTDQQRQDRNERRHREHGDTVDAA